MYPLCMTQVISGSLAKWTFGYFWMLIASGVNTLILPVALIVAQAKLWSEKLREVRGGVSASCCVCGWFVSC